LQPVGRVPTCGWDADLSRASDHSDSGPHLRRDPRPSRSPSGAPSVPKLGRFENENPLAGQHLELANSNLAEVGTVRHNLIPTIISPRVETCAQEVDQCSISEFRLRGQKRGIAVALRKARAELGKLELRAA